MGDYGFEFVNFAADEVFLGTSSDESEPIATVLARVVRGRDYLRIIYFSPRRYLIDRSVGDIVFPEGVELRFAPGAWLDPDPDVTLIVRGSIRAGRHQIFGRPTRSFRPADLSGRYPHLPNADRLPRSLAGLSSATVNALSAYISRQSAPRGLIRIESLEIEEIYPEWWGAVFNESDTTQDSSDALQACFNAACRDRVRDGQSLPALPVSMRGPYLTERKIVVEAPRGLPGALWLRGEDPVSHGGVGPASISRRSNNPLRELGLTDLNCAVELGPRVSMQVDGVSFQSIWSGSVGDENEVRGVLDIRRDAMEADRSVILDRCGFGGGSASAIAVVEDHPEQTHEGRLRLSLSQCTLNAFRQDIPARSRIPARFIRSRRLMDLRLRAEDTVGMRACFTRSLKQTGTTPPEVLLRPLDYQTAVFVVGGALHVRGSTFHCGDGPRPSRPTKEAVPDGQDIWLERIGAERATQLTVQAVESQSWWFLGGRPSFPLVLEPSTLLLGFSGGNVQWTDAPFNAFLTMTNARFPGMLGVNAAGVPPHPPPVAWPGGNAYLVTVGCRFRQYVTLGSRAVVYDVGSTFELLDPSVQSAPRWLRPRFTPRPPDYRIVSASPSDDIPVFALPVLARLAGE